MLDRTRRLPTRPPGGPALPATPRPEQVLRIAERMARAGPEKAAEAILADELRRLARRRERQGMLPDLIAVEWQALERRVRGVLGAVRLLQARQTLNS